MFGTIKTILKDDKLLKSSILFSQDNVKTDKSRSGKIVTKYTIAENDQDDEDCQTDLCKDQEMSGDGYGSAASPEDAETDEIIGEFNR